MFLNKNNVAKLEKKLHYIELTKKIIGIINLLFLLFAVFLPILLAYLRVINRNVTSFRFIEISALVFCIINLFLLAIVESYTKKLANDINNKDNASSKNGIRNILTPMHFLALSGATLSVVAEILSVINLYHNYGFDTALGNFPLNLAGLLDVTSSFFGLTACIIILVTKIYNYNTNKKQTNDEKLNESIKPIILAVLSVITSIMFIVGRSISSMESTQAISMYEVGNGNLSIGIIIRISALLIAIILSIIGIKIFFSKKDNKELMQTSTEISKKDNKEVATQTYEAMDIKKTTKEFSTQISTEISKKDNKEVATQTYEAMDIKKTTKEFSTQTSTEISKKDNKDVTKQNHETTDIKKTTKEFSTQTSTEISKKDNKEVATQTYEAMDIKKTTKEFSTQTSNEISSEYAQKREDNDQLDTKENINKNDKVDIKNTISTALSIKKDDSASKFEPLSKIYPNKKQYR